MRSVSSCGFVGWRAVVRPRLFSRTASRSSAPGVAGSLECPVPTHNDVFEPVAPQLWQHVGIHALAIDARDDQDARARLAQNKIDLSIVIHGQDGVQDSPDPKHGNVNDDRFDPVRKLHGHNVARPDPEIRERRGKRMDLPRQLLVRMRPSACSTAVPPGLRRARRSSAWTRAAAQPGLSGADVIFASSALAHDTLEPNHDARQIGRRGRQERHNGEHQ